ncbi:MAG: ATP-binding protein [Desulfobacteraceae bacterium]|nr:ATP-binding protein [Desulfobacteraceae bacterium]
MPWYLLKNLPSFLRTWDYKARAVLFKDRRGWRLVDLLAPCLIDPVQIKSDQNRPDQIKTDQIKTDQIKTDQIKTDQIKTDLSRPVLGVAIDLGTTRIVIRLLDLESNQILGEVGFDNPQVIIGPDVLARIHHSNKPGGLDQLQGLLVDGVNANLSRLCRENGCDTKDIYLVTGAGNTAMTHLFLGVEAFEIIREPYIPCVNIPDTLMAREVGININDKGLLFVFPNIGSYFGGDLIAGILFADLDKSRVPCLMVDVGTNAEIVVGSRDWLIACAGAAGPALEGGVSKMGMTAGPGVIDRVTIDPVTREVNVHTIEEKRPVGICGSGMIDLAAALFLSGMIDVRGKFSEKICGDRLRQIAGILFFVLVDKKSSGTGQDICLSQIDLNSLTSSKAAMYTILEVIVEKTAGLEFEDLETFYVAGTFGSFIKPASAISIGMLPDIDQSRFEVLGNSSLGGAALLLQNPSLFDRIMEIRQSITYVELNVNQEFMTMFSGAKFYPHTDRSRFPSVDPV